MSIHKPGSIPTQPSVNTTIPEPVGPVNTASPGDPGPRLGEPGKGWQDLPNDVLGRLMDLLIAETLSPDSAPDERTAALNALLDLGSFSSREQQVVNDLLSQTQLDRRQLQRIVKEARRSQWLAAATHLETQRTKLRDDFSVTRELIMEAGTTKKSVVLPEDREGIAFCFKEISLSPAISTLISTLNGKTVKLDASGIGRDRFGNEILPALEKIPLNCRVVLDAADNKLTSDDLGKLTSLMAKKGNLYRLDLSCNPLTEGADGAAKILNLFKQAGPLTHLYLSDTGLDNSTAEILKNSPRRSTMLEQLDLRNNQLDASGISALLQAFVPESAGVGFSCPALDLLRLAGNPCDKTDELKGAHDSAMYRQYQLNRPAGPEPNPDAGIVFGGDPLSLGLRIELPRADEFTDLVRTETYISIADGSRL